MSDTMKKSMRLSLRANEKIYINGAILRADRKVTFELLNDATFLLESHVIQADETTTPLRQLYFVVQTMLIDPRNREIARAMFDGMLMSTSQIFEDKAILAGLEQVDGLVAGGRHFDALKLLRALFPAEAAIVAGEPVAELPTQIPVFAREAVSPFLDKQVA